MSQKLYVAALFARKGDVIGRIVYVDRGVDAQYILADSSEEARVEANRLVKDAFPPTALWKDHATVVREVPSEVIEKMRIA